MPSKWLTTRRSPGESVFSRRKLRLHSSSYLWRLSNGAVQAQRFSTVRGIQRLARSCSGSTFSVRWAPYSGPLPISERAVVCVCDCCVFLCGSDARDVFSSTGPEPSCFAPRVTGCSMFHIWPPAGMTKPTAGLRSMSPGGSYSQKQSRTRQVTNLWTQFECCNRLSRSNFEERSYIRLRFGAISRAPMRSNRGSIVRRRTFR